MAPSSRPPRSEQALASPSDSPLELTLSIVIPAVEPLSVTIQKGIARGNIVTQRDVESTRQTLLAARRERVAAAQDSVAREVEARGGEVVGRCEFLTCMNLRRRRSKGAGRRGRPQPASAGHQYVGIVRWG